MCIYIFSQYTIVLWSKVVFERLMKIFTAELNFQNSSLKLQIFNFKFSFNYTYIKCLIIIIILEMGLSKIKCKMKIHQFSLRMLIR